MTETLRIASRQSQLALWQANHIRDRLIALHPGLDVEIVGFTTAGDRNQTSPLSSIGGKGLFVKELEQALLDEKADIAVHSMKDVPGEFPTGLELAVICERVDPRDAIISHSGLRLAELPADAKIGSSSLRRRYQLMARYPELRYDDLRGNVDTRLRKLDAGEYDAIVLAASGLSRLGLSDRITEMLDVETSIPAAGQGALGIECRENDNHVRSLIEPLNHPDTFDCVSCERAVTVALMATCNLPIAAFAQLQGESLHVATLVASADGAILLRHADRSPRARAAELAERLAKRLLDDGAGELINAAAH